MLRRGSESYQNSVSGSEPERQHYRLGLAQLSRIAYSISMPDKVQFSSARLDKFSRIKKEGSSTWVCPWNAKAAEAMKWPAEIHPSETGSNLEGVLHAESFEVKPSKAELAKHAFTLSGATASGFETARRETVDGKKGKGHRTELWFTVKFSDPNGMRKLEQWWNSVGAEKGSVTISYVSQPPLPLQSEEAKQATLPEND